MFRSRETGACCTRGAGSLVLLGRPSQLVGIVQSQALLPPSAPLSDGLSLRLRLSYGDRDHATGQMRRRYTVPALGLTTPGGDAECRTGRFELGEWYGCWDTGGGADGKELLTERGLRWRSE